MKKKVKSNQVIDTKIQSRNKVTTLRTGKSISSYKFEIAISNKKSLIGELSRPEMEMIYRLYTTEGANLQLRTIAREFTQYSLEDLKRILKAFKITKASCALAPHQLEEMTTDEASEYALRIKEKTFVKKIEEDKVKFNESKVKELLKETTLLKEELKSSNALLRDVNFKNLPTFQKPVYNSGKNDLVIYLSDMHIGAYVNEEGVYENEYSKEITSERLNKIYKSICNLAELNSITVFNLGDAIDGFNRSTTRPEHNHDLPQNMSNREQIRNYIELMYSFFKSLSYLNVPVKFVSVCESNHGGDNEYAATLALSALLEHSGIKTHVANKPIEHLKIGNTTFIYLHGKDNRNMFKNFPLVVNPMVENYFNEYIMRNQLTGKIVVVKGDLHQSATTSGKFFTYKSVGSLFGASNWIHANFGKTEWACDYSLLCGSLRLDGIIEE